MHITPVYAALLALMFVFLSVRVLSLRRRLAVAVGDGGDPTLLRAMRVHANFAEYVPLALLLIAFAEMRGAPNWAVHAVGLVLVAGRVAHAIGVSRVQEDFRYRMVGMTCTLGVIGVVASYLLLATVASVA